VGAIAGHHAVRGPPAQKKSVSFQADSADGEECVRTDVNAAPETQAIPVGTHFHRQQYLFGFAPIAEVVQHVRTQAARGEIERLPDIVAAWNAIRPDIDAVLSGEAGLSETGDSA
jgi:hypothetical protein